MLVCSITNLISIVKTASILTGESTKNALYDSNICVTAVKRYICSMNLILFLRNVSVHFGWAPRLVSNFMVVAHVA